MKEPDGYNGYEGGAPYWVGPNGEKYYDYNEWCEIDRIYCQSRCEQREKELEKLRHENKC